MARIAYLTLLIALSLLLVSACTTAPAESPSPTPSAPIPTTIPTPTPDGNTTSSALPASPLPAVADVVERVEPSVVYIAVEYLESSFFFQSVRTKTGSGVIISSDGYIMTNSHVVEDARSIDVVLPNIPITYEARIIGTDPLSDLAVIKIEGQDLPTCGFGDTSKMRIGDWVIAIGNALGLEGGPSVTVGIVSNLDRALTLGDSRFYDVIQTDAAINPGNSGGPLVNMQGEVVGINTFIITTAQNIGFAVNANTASRVYDNLVQYGRVTRPYLGVRFQTLTPALAADLDLVKDMGVLVTFIEPDSPSDKAGLKARDVITQFQGHDVSDASEMIKLLWQYKVGDSVKVTFWREEERHEISVTLAERPEGI